MGLLVLLLGLVFASMYVYRYFFITQVGVTWEVLPAPSAGAARPPLREVLLVFVALHCGNSGARLLGAADEAFLKWYAQADLHPQCQEWPSRNSSLKALFCYLFSCIKISHQLYLLNPTSLLLGVQQYESMACEGRKV